MKNYIKLFFICLVFLVILIVRGLMAEEKRDIIHMTLKDGVVVIETRPDLAPKHVTQIKTLIEEGHYNGVVFHRVIKGFMAQTGDVEFGNSSNDNFEVKVLTKKLKSEHFQEAALSININDDERLLDFLEK